MPEQPARILLVGHCVPDAYALRSAIASMIPGVQIEFVRDQASLDATINGATLALVNRKLDGQFGASDGVELIRSLAGQGGARVMLVSNLPEAQAAASDLGAAPGFGKRDLYADQTRQRLKAALGLT